MSKIITLKCHDCLNKATFKVGADSDMQSLKDAVARLKDKKETEKILAMMVSIESKKPRYQHYNFYLNHAEYLTNINYDLFPGTVHMFKPEELEANTAYTRLMVPPVSDKIKVSKNKWAMAAALEGTLAFNGIFYCRKCEKFENRLFIRVRYLDGKKENIYILPNRCSSCGEPMQLVNDDNCGFVHEGMETIGKCDVCGSYFKVDGVTFNK